MLPSRSNHACYTSGHYQASTWSIVSLNYHLALLNRHSWVQSATLWGLGATFSEPMCLKTFPTSWSLRPCQLRPQILLYGFLKLPQGCSIRSLPHFLMSPPSGPSNIFLIGKLIEKRSIREGWGILPPKKTKLQEYKNKKIQSKNIQTL